MGATVRKVMEQSSVAFGTSGARGLVTAMTDRVCFGYSEGFLRHLLSRGCWQRGGAVALAGDLRPSTSRIISACAQAVRFLGGKVLFCGFVPTPALAHFAMQRGVPAIMVTGSHIPDDRNGIKFYSSEGEILKEDESAILDQVLSEQAWDEDGSLCDLPALPAPISEARVDYVSRYIDFFGRGALRNLRIGVYQHSAVGRDILAEVLAELGAEVLPLGRSETFTPVDTEAIRPEDVVLARQWAAEHALQAIVSTDGDSDRPMIADEKGEWLRGDVLAMLCARELDMNVVVTPVSSNSMVESCGIFERIVRTRIGSPYVVKAITAALADGEEKVCGYEANGGFLLGSGLERSGVRLAALPTRDAVLPIVTVLLASKAASIGAMVDGLPRVFTFSDRITDVAAARRDALMHWMLQGDAPAARLAAVFAPIAGAGLTIVDVTDGVRMNFGNGRVIHLRASGNAPEMRCYAEAESLEVARELGARSLAFVADEFRSVVLKQ